MTSIYLRYHVTSPPYDTDNNTPLDCGLVTLCEQPGVTLTQFSQAQVNHRKVCYIPPSQELGLVKRIIQFRYDVEDTNGNTLTG